MLKKTNKLENSHKVTSETLIINFREWLENNTETLLEASIRELASSYNIPKEFAKHVKNKCSGRNANTILKIFLTNYDSMINELTSEAAKDKKKLLIDNYIMEFDRYMGFVGDTTDTYLKKNTGKKAKNELIELAKKDWTGYLKKMREFKESLNESRLSKTWKKRIKDRARRHNRDVSEEDKKWAKKQQKKWNSEHPELEEAYLKEIESALESARATKNYLETLRMLRRKKIEAKKAGMYKPDEKPKTKDLPPKYNPKKPHNRIKGGATHTGDIKPSGGTGASPAIIEQEENKNEDV